MNALELIKNRRTIHSFSDEKVPVEIVRSAIEAAIHAPNHHLTWPWFFIQVEGARRQKLADLHVKLKSAKSPMADVAQAAARAKILESPIMILAGVKKPAGDKIYPDQAREDYASLACAIQNMALFLWSENVGLKWSTGGLVRSPESYSILGISPEANEIAGVLFIGYPKVTPRISERPPLERFFRTVE